MTSLGLLDAKPKPAAHRMKIVLHALSGKSVAHLTMAPSHVPHKQALCRCARLCHAVSQAAQIITDAGTAQAIANLMTGQDKIELELTLPLEDSESWGTASRHQQQTPVPAMPMCFNACLDIATCYAAPVHPRYIHQVLVI